VSSYLASLGSNNKSLTISRQGNVGQTDERQDRFEVRFEELEVGKRSAGKKRTVTDRYNNHDRL
jgi:hypothetical protein